MGDRITMSISADSPSDETLNRGPLALLVRRQYEFPFGINVVQFSFLFFFFNFSDMLLALVLCRLATYVNKRSDNVIFMCAM